ncbi:hypothetical protein NRS6121_21030 [Bacillus subtilis]|nr:hypothetical protein S101267_04231 [Bacillus amyloliquefaciens]CAF1817714.1 hypothetical protein NRS6121_02163 [Bacillus subtilis]CAI6326587.1 hypothetical protein NRS6121_21030 [Bacillus subtilis]
MYAKSLYKEKSPLTKNEWVYFSFQVDLMQY